MTMVFVQNVHKTKTKNSLCPSNIQILYIVSKTYVLHGIVVVGQIEYGLWLLVLGIHQKCIP